MRSGASYAVIGEAVPCHYLGIIKVSAIDHDGVFEFLTEAAEIEVGELLPLGEDEQGVGAVSGFVGRIGELNV